MKFYFLLCFVILTLGCNYQNEQLKKDEELKKKEIELRMKELEMKEKELRHNEIILEEKQRDFEDQQSQNEKKEIRITDDEMILKEKQRNYENNQIQNIKKETEEEIVPLKTDNFGNLWTNSAGDYLSFTGNKFTLAATGSIKSGTFELSNNTLKLYFDDNTQKRFRFYYSDEKNLYMLTNDRGNYFYESALSNKHK